MRASKGVVLGFDNTFRFCMSFKARLEEARSLRISSKVRDTLHLIVMNMLIVHIIGFLSGDFLLYEFIKVVLATSFKIWRTKFSVF